MSQKDNITRRLVIGFSSLILTYLIFGLYSLYDIRTISGLTRTIYNHPLVVSNAALQSNVAITKMHRDMKDVVLFKSTSRIQNSIAAVDQQEKLVYQYLDIVRDRILGAEGKNLEKETRTLFENWRPIRKEVIVLVRNGQRVKAAEITIGKGADHVAKLEEKMIALTDYAKSKATRFMRESESTHSRLNVSSIVFLILAISVSAMIAIFTLKRTASAENEIRSAMSFIDRVVDMSPFAMWISDRKGTVIRTNSSLRKTLNLTDDEIVGQYNVLKDENLEIQGVMPMVMAVFENHEPANFSIPWRAAKAGDVNFEGALDLYIDVSIFPIVNAGGELTNVVCQWVDITERKKAEKELRKIEWLLEKEKVDSQEKAKNYIPDYGDVTKLNTERTILDNVGAETLKTLCSDIMDLLDTSIAIYEKNGDYAFGQFDSTWCRTMDLASFRLCNTQENKKALTCGKWLCHENCWNDSAKEAIKTQKATDIECVGGIHLYAVPIYVGENLIGVINMGYGNPPTDERTLKDLAEKYHVEYDVLIENAKKYKDRPPFIIENAKKRLHTVAQLIGRIVDSSKKEKQIVKAKEKAEKSEANLRDAQRIANIGNWSLDLQTGTVEMSDEMFNLIGLKDKNEALDVSNHEKYYTPESWQRFGRALETARNTGESYEIELEFSDKNAKYRNALARGEALYGENNEIIGLKGTLQDITERKKANRVRNNLEHQLFQSQKMESVGLLAGGVAHDYNNMLNIITGYSELALEKVDPNDPLHDDLMEIFNAAMRSTDITRQLLAFSRQQTIAPKVLDLNNTIESMLKMLRRLIGEDIDLAWLPGMDAWPVKMDPSQVDQILANLCVNARDAIIGVGKVTIETRNTSFDEDYCADHAGFVPGEYVLLAVSDDGSGMAPETMNKIFEPFFTTKGQGKGTGLGLATIYGIVKQNDGFINVYSEPDKGTSIKIYFPRHTGQGLEAIAEDNLEIPISQGSEVVLLVEDDASILKLGERILENLGYKVLSANGPQEAMKLAEKHTGEIHLLITDVVMPEMNGRELSEQIKTLYPELRILFMSGYTANVIAHRGVLEDGVSFISKPFSKMDMANKIRKVLDAAKSEKL